MRMRVLAGSAAVLVILLSGSSPSTSAGVQSFPSSSPQFQKTPGPAAARTAADLNFGKMPLCFLPNQGQLDEAVAFYVQGKDKTLYFGPDGITFSLYDLAERASRQSGGPEAEGERDRSLPQARWNVKLDFMSANPDVRPVGEDRAAGVVSYFKGRPEDWRTGLPTYSRIVYRELWPGIDLAYSGNVNELKYEFIVHPGGDPSQIRLAYRGATGVKVDEAGQLQVHTPAGSFRDGTPVAYQEIDGRRLPVALAYSLSDPAAMPAAEKPRNDQNEDTPYSAVTYGFAVGGYDHTQPLVMDPVMFVYCGFLGGSNLEYGRAVACDASGNAYITGYTASSQATFPVTTGPDLTYAGGYDAFVAKVNAAGTGLVYCGYIGGLSDDYGQGIAVDASGNAHITGRTYSTESSLPVTVGPDLTHNGSFDAFVAKINASGTGLIYCGYIGGSGDDWGWGIGLDGTGNAYISGNTNSTESTFPVTVGPDLTYNGGSGDVFAAKVNAAGTGLSYCGYIGGDYDEYGYAIAVDGSGRAYLAGKVDSFAGTFPVTVGPDLTFGGGSDAYVARVNAAGTGLDYCGYIGGIGNDYGYGVAVDGSGNAYVTGHTRSYQDTFPVSVGPDLTFNGGTQDVFVVKVNPSGTGFVFGGYIGGSANEYAYAVSVDSTGNAYVVGDTASTEASFPVCGGPDLSYNGGSSDGFVAMVKASGQGLVYCGYLGGSGYDQVYGVAADGSGAFITGFTDSAATGFPVVAGPDLTLNGNYDAFVARVTGPPLWEPRHAAGDFDGDGADELAIDFGASGAWLWDNGAWSQLTPVNPEGLLTAQVEGGQPDRIVADLGALGVWQWGGGAWTQLSGVNAESLAVFEDDADGNSEVLGDFGAAGLWSWSGTSWTQLSGVNADYVTGNDFDGNGADDVLGDFGPTGLWLWTGGTWSILSGVNADYMTVGDFTDDGISESLVGDFGTTGLWKWTGGLWMQLSGVNSDLVVVGNPDPAPGEEIFGDFGPTGLWLWTGGTWSILSGVDAEYFVWIDINGDWIDELAADFGALGLWFWDAGAWTQVSGVDPDYLMIADTDGDDKYELLADFGTLGLWVKNDGAWAQISANNPE